jgi:cardiolipin synthase
VIGWPLGALAAWFALNLGVRTWRQYRHQRDPVANEPD